MARTDAIVLGAGIVGVSVALHLAKRGLAVALVDRNDPGQARLTAMPASSRATRCFRRVFPLVSAPSSASPSGGRRRPTTICSTGLMVDILDRDDTRQFG
jgi:2-polyprenyl-6-methoxyphenol hydroxylase-like FAD-dependent oxidoreductase